MKFTVASDLHLEQGPVLLTRFKNPGVDVLVLAGDIVELRLVEKTGPEYQYLRDFFEYINSEYETVIWICGNHEFYSCYDMEHARKKARSALKSRGLENIHLLHDETFEVKGVPFHCTTLWTDIKRGDPSEVLLVQDTMNDYKYIRNSGSKIRAYTTMKLNLDAKKFLRGATQDGRDCVVVTHHQPLVELLRNEYSSGLDYAYGNTDLHGFLDEKTNVKIWVSGHTHEQFDDLLGGQRFVTNCHGYPKHDSHLHDKFKLSVYELEN